MSFQILTRDVPPRSAWSLEQAGIHPLLSRLFAARGILSPEELDDGLAKLLPPQTLKGTQEAAQLLAHAIEHQRKVCIVADYDCDGATACAVGLRGLRMLGAQHVSYIVPDRVVDGYGLTASIAKRVKESGADLLVTVDNGIASIEGVAAANAIGLPVLVLGLGGDPVVVGAVGMLAGFCGTLLSPMAANFNIVPAALLNLPDRYAVIRAQWPTAVLLWLFNTAMIWGFAFR